MQRRRLFPLTIIILSLGILLNADNSKTASDHHHHQQQQHEQQHKHGTGHSDEHFPAENGNAGGDSADTKTKNIRRHPVHIFKGAEPWRPLSNSVPFGVSPVELSPASIDEEEPSPQNGEPQSLAVDDPSNNVPLKVSGTLNGFAPVNTTDQWTESEVVDYNESGKTRPKNGLHESLRRPLRRLTDRQLALLLKQIRKQRRGQFAQTYKETEENSINNRQEMLAQLKNLLGQPQNGQRLIRPKLLTNVNILPNEWNIYPPLRGAQNKQKGSTDGKSDQQRQEQEEQQQHALSVYTINIGGNLYDLSGDDEQRQREHQVSFAGSSTTQSPTTSADPILTPSQFELKATIRPPIVQSVELISEQQTPATSTQTTFNNLSPADGFISASNFEQLPAKLETDQHQVHEENTQKKGKDNSGNGTATAAKLEAGWQLVEQHFMDEMRTAVQKADSAIEKLDSQRKESAGGNSPNKTESPTSEMFASKMFNLSNKNNATDNDQSEFKVFNVSHFAEQERSQLGELSTALREIRHRYENVKQQFQGKMRRLGLAHRFKTPTQFKAAGTTTFIEEEAQNGTETEFGHNLDNRTTNAETTPNTANGTTIGNETEVTTAAQKNVDAKTASTQEEQHTTAVPIPNSSRNGKPHQALAEHKNGNNDGSEGEGSQKNGKAKPKLTLAELADELEQIERTIATRKGKAGLKELEIESGTLQKAKKILHKDKKVNKQKSRSRISSSPPAAKSDSLKASANGGISASVEINKILKKIKTATANREVDHPKVEKQHQTNKSRGSNNEDAAAKAADVSHQRTKGQQHQAVQTHNSQQQQQPAAAAQPAIPFVKMTAKSRISLTPSTPEIHNKLKTILVDTSTKHGHANAQHQQVQQQFRPIQQDHQPGEQNQNDHLGGQHQQHLYQPIEQYNPQKVQQQQQPPQFVQQQQYHYQAQLQHVQRHEQQQQQQQNQLGRRKLNHEQQQQHAFVQHSQQLTQLSAAAHSQSMPRTQMAQGGGGFYQLERAQVANVSQQKMPKPSSSSELKLKGVAQLEVGKSIDQTPVEITNSQLSSQLRKERLRKNGTKQLHKEDDDLANLEEFARIDEQAICDAIACNFETGSLCEWETSIDELNPGDPRYRRYMMARTVLLTRHRRSKRNEDEVVRGDDQEEEEDAETAQFGQNLLEDPQGVTIPTTTTTHKKGAVTTDKQSPPLGGRTVLRSWHNWVGRYRNRLTGIAQSEIFSTRNQRFAASYLKPGQRSTLTGRLLSGDRATIRFKAWEATRFLQLRVCCDRTDRDENCVFTTELGVKLSNRKWKDHLATCPQGTKKIIFECRNVGPFQGACGVDNIQLINSDCPSVTPMKANRKLLRK